MGTSGGVQGTLAMARLGWGCPPKRPCNGRGRLLAHFPGCCWQECTQENLGCGVQPDTVQP